MSLGIIVFSRFDSRRLPGKALRPVAGRALIGRVLDRVRRVTVDAHVVVATTDRNIDNPIEDFCNAESVSVFRGSVDDVAGRAMDCVDAFGFDRFVRISGDSPFIDPMIMEELIILQRNSNADVSTNILKRTFPPGVSVEVVTRSTMNRITSLSKSKEEREHVTKYIYNNPNQFHIEDITAPNNLYQGVSLTVDTDEDLAKAAAITQFLGRRPEQASLAEVSRIARRLQSEPANV